MHIISPSSILLYALVFRLVGAAPVPASESATVRVVHRDVEFEAEDRGIDSRYFDIGFSPESLAVAPPEERKITGAATNPLYNSDAFKNGLTNSRRSPGPRRWGTASG
ncbi:hypothetical protein MKEN_00309300 [Mycena kentingensis (nom. inval.)]|nr:hypothetical protein MKEN_00309300 [Mycena kentingensis (nom. inval.)]